MKIQVPDPSSKKLKFGEVYLKTLKDEYSCIM